MARSLLALATMLIAGGMAGAGCLAFEGSTGVGMPVGRAADTEDTRMGAHISVGGGYASAHASGFAGVAYDRLLARNTGAVGGFARAGFPIGVRHLQGFARQSIMRRDGDLAGKTSVGVILGKFAYTDEDVYNGHSDPRHLKTFCAEGAGVGLGLVYQHDTSGAGGDYVGVELTVILVGDVLSRVGGLPD